MSNHHAHEESTTDAPPSGCPTGTGQPRGTVDAAAIAVGIDEDERRSGRRRPHAGRRWHDRRSRKHRRRRPDWNDPVDLERHQRDLEQRAADIAARIDRVRARINELDRGPTVPARKAGSGGAPGGERR